MKRLVSGQGPGGSNFFDEGIGAGFGGEALGADAELIGGREGLKFGGLEEPDWAEGAIGDGGENFGKVGIRVDFEDGEADGGVGKAGEGIGHGHGGALAIPG